MLPVFARDFNLLGARPWSPLLREVLSDFPGSSQDLPGREQLGFSPAYDIEETEESFLLSFDVPGVHRDDLNIEVTGRRLLVSGERKAEGFGGRSKRFGKFQYAFSLPEGIAIEAISADHKDGVLKLTLPKVAEAKTTKIKIGDSNPKAGFLKSLITERKPKEEELV